MTRYVCIHGHFYQPPRENPWLEEVELQESAHPFHDWNERITDECYAPNAASRILDDDGRIADIADNYERISFDFGPTLLSWMERAAPEAYRAVVEADAKSRARFSGHGSAMAQAYNHAILPLADARDKRTQVAWGVRDFEHRFGRAPEGMWLPETAVDLESLDLLAEHGVRFTVLEPGQARRVRPLDASADWLDVRDSSVDPTRAYLQRLPSGRSIAVLFYDGPASRAIAFEGLLRSGETFAGRLRGLFHAGRRHAQLVHVATDGETYGHHHRHGDMALAWALDRLERDPAIRLTNYGEFLERHPPEQEVDVREETSWSCVHGVERWRSDCGCSDGANPGFHQAWREPLRAALDALRDAVRPPWERAAARLLRDPWAARDAYIDVVLDRDRADAFLADHAARALSSEERVRALELLELQRHAMLMYTSCGWFFDELSRIEALQVLRYAGRVVQLARDTLGVDLEPDLLSRLAKAPSNVPDVRDGAEVWRRWVAPAVVDLPKVAAHYALSALFEDAQRDHVYCYATEPTRERVVEAGRARLGVARLRVSSRITGASGDFSYGVLHLGDHNLSAAVRPWAGEEEHERMASELLDTFTRGDLTETVRRLDRSFGGRLSSVKSLFRDEQQRVMDLVLEATLAQVEDTYRHVFDDHFPLMRFMSDMAATPPRALRTAAEFVLNVDLQRLLAGDQPDEEEIVWRLEAARDLGAELDVPRLVLALERTIERLARRLARERDPALVHWLRRALALGRRLPGEVDPWETQNIVWGLLREVREGGFSPREAWEARLRPLAEALSLRVPEDGR